MLWAGLAPYNHSQRVGTGRIRESEQGWDEMNSGGEVCEQEPLHLITHSSRLICSHPSLSIW